MAINGGFEKTMVFTRKDDPKRKVTLTEKSSRQISHQINTARGITMQCMEYQLSTRGRRKGYD